MQATPQEQFETRLSRWISSQGFWFQLRHSIDSSSGSGHFAYHLLRLFFRILIFVIILSIGGLYYLVKRTDSTSFRTDLRNSITESIGAEQIAMRGARRVQGNLEISRLASEGGPDTFFEFLEMRNITCQMGLLDGLFGVWNPGVITINQLDMQLRAGTDSPEDAAKIADVIFRRFDNITANNFEIARANIGWGYSERTRGRIDGARIQAIRLENAWRITIRGGTLSQNWLRDLEIEEIVVICTPEELVFERTDLRHRGGTVDFNGLRVIASDQPELRGTVRVRRVMLDQILPPAARNFVEGSLSGDFIVGGSTNTADGVSFDGMVYLDAFTKFTIRDRIHVLRALSVVDLHNTYRRLDFDNGSFRLTTRAGAMHLRDINIVAGDLATMTGNITARPPTQQEINLMVARGVDSRAGLGGALDFIDDEEPSFMSVEEMERQFSLRQAATAAQRAAEAGGSEEDQRLFDRAGLSFEARVFADQQAARLSRMLVYEGEVELTLPRNAFERTETLQRNFPVDPNTRRIPVRVPLAGPLHELTLDQAEAIYEMGRR